MEDTISTIYVNTVTIINADYVAKERDVTDLVANAQIWYDDRKGEISMIVVVKPVRTRAKTV